MEKSSRTISLNTNYLIWFNKPREIALLDRQVFPDNTKYFIEAFNDAVSTPYVLIQNKAKTPDFLRFRTNLLSDQPLVNITKHACFHCLKHVYAKDIPVCVKIPVSFKNIQNVQIKHDSLIDCTF